MLLAAIVSFQQIALAQVPVSVNTQELTAKYCDWISSRDEISLSRELGVDVQTSKEIKEEAERICANKTSLKSNREYAVRGNAPPVRFQQAADQMHRMIAEFNQSNTSPSSVLEESKEVRPRSDASVPGLAQANLAAVSKGKAASSTAGGRYFFPKNFVRGFVESEMDPPHNERDLGRCVAAAGAYGGVNAPCAAFGRYALGGYLEFRPFARKVGPVPLHRLSFFFEPRSYFGRNVPQYRYSGSADIFLYERSIGLALGLPKDFELRWWQHQNYWLGRYGNYLGPSDLGKNGPYGLYSGVSVRWYFGEYNRRR